jgi:hypothetical protein
MGMLWVLEKRDARFTDAVDKQTSQMFVVWFFLCILLTVTKVMPVANIAHGVGALLGVLLGLAISGTPPERAKGLAGLSIIVSLVVLGSTVFWPWVNCSAYAEVEVERAALSALDNDQVEHAVKLLEMAVTMRQAPARAWYNLGFAYHRAGRVQDSVRAYEHAASMADADADMRKMGAALKGFSVPADTN